MGGPLSPQSGAGEARASLAIRKVKQQQQMGDAARGFRPSQAGNQAEADTPSGRSPRYGSRLRRSRLTDALQGITRDAPQSQMRPESGPSRKEARKGHPPPPHSAHGPPFAAGAPQPRTVATPHHLPGPQSPAGGAALKAPTANRCARRRRRGHVQPVGPVSLHGPHNSSTRDE